MQARGDNLGTDLFFFDLEFALTKFSIPYVMQMGFIMEFAENLILRLMEDPNERDRKFREHMYTLMAKCKTTKEMWSLPIRPYGFWNFEHFNAQLTRDAQISQARGRRDPYDDLLQEHYGSSSK
ncbi:hypothetical protein M569_10894 [Genlisea aurea]|uniref:Uncharacterized protein n=1 Tax=Genlisea aurea TaxID=192259 RepID=S8CAG5_9LAMI|nr:hypothetical protein M569_10894 [Genlisea aurea]